MTKNVRALIAGLSIFVTAAAQNTAIHSGHSSEVSRRAIVTKSTPVYESPGAQLPFRYIDPPETVTVDTTEIDSASTAWFRIKGKNAAEEWIKPDGVIYVGTPGDTGPSAEGPSSKADKMRRYSILRDHPEWPRRIQKAVRDGLICLDMTTEQMVASWGEPSQKSRAFLLGIGDHDIWFFSNEKGRQDAVSLVNGRVIGWSLH